MSRGLKRVGPQLCVTALSDVRLHSRRTPPPLVFTMTQLRLAAPLAAFAVTIAGIFVACSNGEEVFDDSPTAPVTSISAADLPNLVLDVNEVSVDGTILPLDPEDTGPQSLSDQTDGGLDAERMAAMLEQFNWQAAYYQDFGTGSQGSPVFNASVQLDLYDTPEHAAAALSELIDMAATWEGQSVEGVTVDSIELFDVPEFNGKGLRMKVSLADGTSFTMTNIDFVRGPLIVDVGTASLDDRDLLPATLELVTLANNRLIAAGIEPRPNPAAQSY